MFEQKKTKQDEQKIVSSSVESPEVRENDPLEPYRPHIDKFDLTEEQKLELIGAIFSIAHMVLDAKFGQIKDTLSAEKPVDEEAVSINGMRHEN